MLYSPAYSCSCFLQIRVPQHFYFSLVFSCWFNFLYSCQPSFVQRTCLTIFAYFSFHVFSSPFSSVSGSCSAYQRSLFCAQDAPVLPPIEKCFEAETPAQMITMFGRTRLLRRLQKTIITTFEQLHKGWPDYLRWRYASWYARKCSCFVVSFVFLYPSSCFFGSSAIGGSRALAPRVGVGLILGIHDIDESSRTEKSQTQIAHSRRRNSHGRTLIDGCACAKGGLGG